MKVILRIVDNMQLKSSNLFPEQISEESVMVIELQLQPKAGEGVVPGEW